MFFSYPTLDDCEHYNVSCYGAPTTNPANMCCQTCIAVETAYKNMGWKLDVLKISQCSGKLISWGRLCYSNIVVIGNILYFKIT